MKNFKEIKAVIIDDERNSRDLICDIIKSHFPDILLQSAVNTATGIKTINTFNPDIVFLDIDMPDGTGFDVLKNISEYNFKVIFITAHEEYAVKAIKYSALDYILKPVNAVELVNAINKALKKIKSEIEQLKIETLLSNLELFGKSRKRKLVLSTSDNTYIVDTDDIVRCKSDNNYTTFYLNNGNRILMSKTLKEYENLLSPDNFIRIHRSHLINVNYIDRIGKRNSGFLYMKDGTEIPVSHGKRDALTDMLKRL